MLLRYFFDEKLAHASYMVGCQATGEAIVIDPARDIEPYLKTADAEGMSIIAATETHIHADFVSGARELAERTGAKLYLSDEGDKDWKYQYIDQYDHQNVYDGDTFKVGNIKFEVMHTPGHTPEHISFILTDTAGADKPMGIFTGDFVFVGDVGRPDLLEKAAGIANTSEGGAKAMYNSLERFKKLPDYLQVWPAHGAGSACGKALGAIPSSTVGYEKLFNWALGYDQEDKFVDALLAGQPEPPKYFAMMKKLNKVGPDVLHGTKIPEHLLFNCMEKLINEGATIIDTRSVDAFAAGHIPGTLNVPYDKSFTTWAGWVLDYDKPFYLIANKNDISGIVRDLAYIGLDNTAGYFEGSAVQAWSDAGHMLETYDIVTPSNVHEKITSGEYTLVDVRGTTEFEEAHIPNAKHIMLGYLSDRADEIPKDKPVVVQCRTGNRSAVGAGMLKAKGFDNVMNLNGGLVNWMELGLPVKENGH